MMGMKFAVHADFPDPPRNELIVLASEIQDDDHILFRQKNPLPVSSCYRPDHAE